MLNWLVVGVGDIATRRVIPAILEDADSRLRAVVTSKPEKAAALGVPGYQSLEEGLADPEVEAVYVATPVALHAPQARAALAAGKHVLCEKPVGMSYGEAVGIAEAAEAAGLTCGAAYYRRFYPKVREAKRLIESGAIGRPVLAEMHCHYWFLPQDGERSWLVDPALAGGGPLFDIASHRIDLLHYFFGEPARATGLVSRAVHGYATEDNATVVVEHASGVRGYVDVRWHTREYRDECRIVGTEGTLDLTPLNGPRLGAPEGERYLPAADNFHLPLIADFAAAVRAGRAPECPIREAIRTDWVTEQIR